MGSGAWSGDVYDTYTSTRAFIFDSTMKASGRSGVHPSLDPMGLKVRESCDSVEHPTSKAVAVWLDVTGSNIEQAHIVHGELPKLLGLILRKGYLAHPQILFGAVGDATCDAVPLQVGQFESDNRMDEQLGSFYLEGGGGGQVTESYELALYVLARKTAIDCFAKRGEKGYAFIIGDEMAYPHVSRSIVKQVFGEQIEADVPLEQIVREAQEKYELFFIVPTRAAHGGEQRIPDFWRRLLGQNVLLIDDSTQICEMIAAQIGAAEGVAFDSLLADLRDAGASDGTLATVSQALARRGVASSLATVEGDGALGLAGTGLGTPRL